jgi:uncharacterized membrane protein YcaP (DUF421 family)
MKKEDIQWADWHRILIGSAPTEFLIEVFFRSVFLFVFLLIVLRLMGKRMGGMLTISELAVMLTLGAIICVPMQIPDRGILQGFFVLTCALAFQRWFPLLGIFFKKGEQVIEGKEVTLLKDGVIEVKELKAANISKQQLYAVLRSQGLYNLGAVERIYLEAAGFFSVFRFKEPKLGLPIFPGNDSLLKQHESVLACCDCGKITTTPTPTSCSNCSGNTWTPAIK